MFEATRPETTLLEKASTAESSHDLRNKVLRMVERGEVPQAELPAYSRLKAVNPGTRMHHLLLLLPPPPHLEVSMLSLILDIACVGIDAPEGVDG